MNERWDEDPGWRLGLRSFQAMVPVLQNRYYRSLGRDQLVILRTVYSSFLMALLGFGVVLPLITPFRGKYGEFGWVAGVAVLAVVSLTVVRLVEPPLLCESEKALASTFRTRMFLRIAFAEAIALLGFVGSFIALGCLIYYLAVLFSLPGFMRAAPTRAALIRDQAELTARGCSLSLVAVLRQAPPG